MQNKNSNVIDHPRTSEGGGRPAASVTEKAAVEEAVGGVVERVVEGPLHRCLH